MPQIREYEGNGERIQPSSEGFTGYETAARRIGPAYNQAAELQRQGSSNLVNAAKGAERAGSEEVTAGKAAEGATIFQADTEDKLQRAMLAQYKDLYNIGAEDTKTDTKTSSRGGGGGGVRSGRSSTDPFSGWNRGFANDYGAANEISDGSAALTNKLLAHSGKSTDSDNYKNYNKYVQDLWKAGGPNADAEKAANDAYYKGSNKANPEVPQELQFGRLLDQLVPEPTAPPTTASTNWSGLLGSIGSAVGGYFGQAAGAETASDTGGQTTEE